MVTDAPVPLTRLDADVIVLGGGPVGENIAQYATEGTDLTAVVVEGELMGGECSYYACMPSKALLRPISVAGASAHLGGVTEASIEPEQLLARRDEWVSGYDDSGQVDWAHSAGLEVVRGHGRLVGEREVQVHGEQPALLRARHAVVLATGSEPVIPEPLQDLHAWTSRDATGVQEIPEELLIVGGGVVAVEAATWMAALGSRVRMLVRGQHLLSGFEQAAGDHVLHALTSAGVQVELGTSVRSAAREDPQDSGLGRIHGGRVHVTVEGPEGVREVEADELLAATGRRPRLDDVGLASVDVDPTAVVEHGAAELARLTGVPHAEPSAPLPSWLVAVGDAAGEAPLTHWGKYRARVLGQRIRAQATGETVEPEPSRVPVPQVVFSEPQVAAVGLTAQQACEAGYDVVTAEVPYAGAAGSALLRDDADGTAILVVDAAARTVLGATFAGPDAAELLHAATIAITGQVPVHVLRHAVASYPTASELWLRLLEELPTHLRRADG